MKQRGLAFVLLLSCAMVCWGIIRPQFTNLNWFLQRHHDIVVADCIAGPPESKIINGEEVFLEYRNGFRPWGVKIIRTLKGNLQPGNHTVGTTYNMIYGKRYLLSNLSDSTNFQALAELSVVEISDRFDLKQLDDKSLRDQVWMLFADGLSVVRAKTNQPTSRELEEAKALEKAVHDQ